MTRLLLTVEGYTELNFVKRTLAPHFTGFGVFADARCVITSKDKNRQYRGGLTSYQKAKDDILNWMKQESKNECFYSTMFDLYRLPDDFPGYKESKKITDPYAKVDCLEEALKQDIAHPKFIPYIQLHEFEALIFADPRQLDWEYLEHGEAILELQQIIAEQPNPELIDDGEHTAPSKRILQQIPEFDKATAGVAVVKKIGLTVLRDKCTHFAEWLQQLECLGRQQNLGD